MKKNILTVVFRSIAVIFLVSSLSCWTPFEPVTNVGKDVVTSIDSNVTNFRTGFREIDSIFLSVNGARSVITAGSDTSIYRLQSGGHPLLSEAGRFGDDSAIAYAEFQMPTANLAGMRAPCTSFVDSVTMRLYYDTSANDDSIANVLTDSVPFTIQVFLCSRKYFPGDRNDLRPVEDPAPCTTLTIPRHQVDSTIFIALGAKMISRLDSALMDTSGIARYVGRIDTVFGKFKTFNGGDTITGPDTVDNVYTDTIFHVDSVAGLTSAINANTAIVNFTVFHFDSSTSQNNPTSLADTIFQTDTVVNLRAFLTTDTAVITYSAMRFFKLDTTFLYDSSKKFIGAVSIHAFGGGIIRFSGLPIFHIKSHRSCLDTTRAAYSATYEDIYGTETKTIRADSLVTAWQTDRFIEMPISLKPLWDSAKTGATTNFKIVQDAACLLTIDTAEFEGLERHDTTRTIIYGLLDHTISDSRTHSEGTYDSLLAIANAGRFSRVTVNDTMKQVTIPLTMFLQSLADEPQRPSTAYLYLFEQQGSHFGRVVIKKAPKIKFRALFSNSHK
jgi:hypothetical protein